MDTDDDIQQLLSVCSGEWVDGGVDDTFIPFVLLRSLDL